MQRGTKQVSPDEECELLVALPSYRRRALPIAIALVLSGCPFAAFADCGDAESSAEEAYSYARRALREDDFDSAQDLMRRARNAADDARSYAADCDCDDAESSAEDAYTYARRAYNATDLDELHMYAKRAMNAAEETQDAASECS
jgi:hypothetical protein